MGKSTAHIREHDPCTAPFVQSNTTEGTPMPQAAAAKGVPDLPGGQPPPSEPGSNRAEVLRPTAEVLRPTAEGRS